MTLKEMIENAVQKSIADLLGASDDASNVPLHMRNNDGTVDVAKAIEPVTRRTRKRGRGRPKVQYVKATKPGRQRTPAKIAADLPAGNVRITWLAVANAKAPISARELEAKTGLVKKAVESAVWALRNAGHIKSIAVSKEQ